MKWKLLTCTVVAAVIAGCGGGDEKESGEPAENVAKALPPKHTLPPPPPPANGEETLVEVDPELKNRTEVPLSRKAAVVGVGRKGKGYGGGYLGTVLATRFSAVERIVFNAQIPETMKIYYAIHERFPKSHKEFMKAIEGINLPELHADERYRYDPEKAKGKSHWDPDDPPFFVEKMER